MNVIVCGGDRRLTEAGRVLTARGHHVTYCLATNVPEGADICPQTDDLPSAEVLLLPIPLVRGGIFCCQTKSPPPSLSGIEALLSRVRCCFCGGAPDRFVCAARKSDCRLFDLLEDPAFLWENAALTAEAAVGLAIRESEISLRGAQVSIVGHGRIARLLMRHLCALGASVTVFARKPADRAEAVLCGAARALPTDALAQGALGGADLVFNTVPFPLLGPAALGVLSPNACIVELAGGQNVTLPQPPDAPRLIAAPGLPGKWFPVSAGRAVAGAVLRLLPPDL